MSLATPYVHVVSRFPVNAIRKMNLIMIPCQRIVPHSSVAKVKWSVQLALSQQGSSSSCGHTGAPALSP